MPTIIDSLIVELGLDPKGLTKGQKESVDDLRKIEEGYEHATKSAEVSSKKMGQAIYGVRNQLLTLMAAFTAGSGMKSFFERMTNSDASVGRLAKNIDMSTNELTAWQGVAERAGGTAAGIAGTMQGLTEQFQQLALTGQSSVIPYFRTVGVAIADLQTGKMRPLNDILLDLSEKFSKMDPAQAQALGKGMGIDEGTINVLMRGRIAVMELLREQERLGHANDEDAKEAAKRQSALTGLKQVSEDLGRKFLTVLTPAILYLTAALVKMGEWFRQHPRTATIAIGTLTAAVVGLSVAIGVTAVAALGTFAAAGVAAFASLVIAAAPFLLAIGAIAAGGYGIYKAYQWFKGKEGWADRGEEPFAAIGVKSNLPRSQRNNNPGNLEFRGQDGAAREVGGGGRFAAFATMQDGIIALAKQLQLYAARGIDSVTAIIEKYAPAGENNTKAYINALAKAVGAEPNAHLNLNDKNTLRTMIKGISTIEAGKSYLDLRQINAALDARNGAVNSRSSSSRVSIDNLTIQTQATDSQGIARTFGQAMDKYQSTAAMANYGLQ